MIFSVNNLPPSVDKSNGFFRRIVIIPFNAVFSENNPNFDPNIIEKVSTEEAKSYLFNIALRGLANILKNNYITIPNEVQTLVRNYEIDNNSVLQWIEDNMNNIEGRIVNEVYTDYCLYCSNNNQAAVQLRKFNTEIMKRHSDLYIINKDNKNYWKKKTD
jgi:putative DNA primase/helicase